MAVMMMVLRWIVEKYIFRPIGLRVGMRDSRRSYPKSNPVLEASFRKSPHPSHDVVKSLSEDTKLTVMEVRFVDRCHIWMDGMAWTYDTITVSLTHQVQRWFRQRKQAEQPSTLQKFCETGWRFVFYTCIFVYGLLVLWSKHWFWDINGCWVDYPKHKVRCFSFEHVCEYM